MRRLEVIAGRAEPAELDVAGEVVLGRSRDADLRLLDETASRHHARLRIEDGEVLLDDLGSANGTWVAGERVRDPRRLRDGEVVTIGGVQLRFVESEGEAADRPTVVGDGDRRTVEARVDPERADPAREGGDADAVRRLRLVCDAAVACAETRGADEVATTLLELLVEALAPDRATVAWVGSTGEDTIAAIHPTGASPPDSRTLRRRLVEDGEALLVGDAAGEHPEAASLVGSRYRATLAAPLRTLEGTLGYVVLEAEAPRRWGPPDLRALAATCRQAALAVRTSRDLAGARARARPSASQGTGAPRLLGETPAMARVREQIAKAAPVSTPVLVTGETGTGKELVARHLHADGERAGRPFVALNCAAFVEGLVESELFGHEKGAFTGAVRDRAGLVAEAGEGTLFLDEVAELAPAVQAKLLRVLSEGTYTPVGGRDVRHMRCRLVTATHRDLEAMVAEGTFREDLYYRLAVLRIHVPPLRERGEDVLLLAEAALASIADRLGRPVPRLAEDAREALLAWSWPGNVRELLGALERALVLAEGDVIGVADLPPALRRGIAGEDAPLAAEPEAGEAITLEEAERRAVLAALREARGRKGRAAEILATSWPTLNRKIRAHGLEAEVERLRAAD